MFSAFSQVIVVLTLTAPPVPRGHLVGLPVPNGFESLVEYDLNGGAQRVGFPGSLGQPQIVDLTWDGKTGRLLGARLPDENGYVQWIEIDIETGVPSLLSLSRFPTNRPESGVAFEAAMGCDVHAVTGLLYCVVQSYGIVRVNVDTGATAVVNPNDRFHRITWVDGFAGSVTGFIAIDGSQPGQGWFRFHPATWQAIRVGGTPQGDVLASKWIDNTLYRLGWLGACQESRIVGYFDETLGTETNTHCLYHAPPQGPMTNIFEFIPEKEGAVEYCDWMMDTDSDEDIDLQDFSRLQNCMSDPRPDRNDGE